MSTNGLRQEEFAAHLQRWCPRVERVLDTIPAYDAAWEAGAQEQSQRNVSH